MKREQPDIYDAQNYKQHCCTNRCNSTSFLKPSNPRIQCLKYTVLIIHYVSTANIHKNTYIMF